MTLLLSLPARIEHSSQADALKALELTGHALGMTHDVGYKPPRNVAALQTAMCCTFGPVTRFFNYHVRVPYPDVPKLYSEDSFWIQDILGQLAMVNLKIQDTTRTFLEGNENHWINESSYIISHEMLQSLVHVARRGNDLLVYQRISNPARDASIDYNQLRKSAERFISQLQLPHLFLDALGLACENVSLGLSEVKQRHLQMNIQRLYNQFLARSVEIRAPAIYITQDGIEKQVLSLFKMPPGTHQFLLKSPSRNPSFPEIFCYNLVNASDFLDLRDRYCREGAVCVPGDMKQWQLKVKQEFKIKAVAESAGPNPRTILLLAESSGSIQEQWYLDQDYVSKWGYECTDTWDWDTLRVKCGQLNEEEQHMKMLVSQLRGIEGRRRLINQPSGAGG